MKEYAQNTKQLSRTIQGSGRDQRTGFVDNRPLNVLSKVIQGDFINLENDAAIYPHLHTEHQYIGYTYIPGHHVEIRSNAGAIHQAWLHNVGMSVPRKWNAIRRENHQAILDWIRLKEPNVWNHRWHY